jgi:hypothetical protein
VKTPCGGSREEPERERVIRGGRPRIVTRCA